MSAIIGRHVREGDMPSGSELCLDCADAFDWRGSSRERRDVTLLWIYEIHTCTMQGAAKCWTFDAVEGSACPPPSQDITVQFDKSGRLGGEALTPLFGSLGDVGLPGR